MLVWENPDKCDVNAYTISIFGDLRDHHNAKEIIDWFKKVCSKLFVRDATVVARNAIGGTISWSYREEE